MQFFVANICELADTFNENGTLADPIDKNVFLVEVGVSWNRAWRGRAERVPRRPRCRRSPSGWSNSIHRAAQAIRIDSG